MKLNKLLAKQLKKFFPEDYPSRADLQPFLAAVNDSYNAYDRDIELSDRAFKVTEDEYREINDRLNQEVVLKKASINKLYEAIEEIGVGAISDTRDENDLLYIATYIKSHIAALRETEKRLHDQKQFYERILNELPADIAVFDDKHRYIFVNPLGIGDPQLREWLIGRTDEDYCTYRNRDMSIAMQRRKLFDDAVSTKGGVMWEEQLKLPDGGVSYHLRKMYPVFSDNNELEMVIGYGVDITERKKIEEQIRISELRYRSIFDYSLALICTHDLDGVLMNVNNATMATLGYTRKELQGSPLQQFIAQDKRSEFETTYLSKIRFKGSAEGIMVVVNKYGKRVYLLYQNFLVTDDTEQPYIIGFSQDITARIQAEKALKKSEEKYRSIITNMHLGLLEVDRNNNVIYANNSFCEMSGYELRDLAGENASMIFDGARHYDLNQHALNKTIEDGGQADEISVTNKKGEARWWLISTAPNFDQSGNFRGSVGIHLDITPQKKLEHELRHAKSAAEQSSQAKEVFLTNISHEIRTPMNAILGIGKLLNKTTLEGQQRFYVDTIQNAANNLLVIINDLLDFSKIEAGKISLESIGFEPGSIAGNIIQILKHKSEEKGLAINYKQSPGIAPVLIGDPYRINQVLLNLLGNALKFTEKGSVTLSCILMADNDETQELLFKVEDTGIGMSPEFVAQIFEKFSQEDESVTRRFGGTGLGMSISKQLVDLMGGSIQVESRKNVGTAISFAIKLRKGAARDLPDNNTAIVDSRLLKGRRILLVEDNEINRLISTTILLQYGAEVVEAEDGMIAIERCFESIFDLILMDVQMPVKDGIEATKYIRKNINSSVPIIALTANAYKKEEERCLAAGMNDLVSKPFNEDTLMKVMAKWLNKESRQVSLSGALQEAPTNAAANFDKLKAFSKGNNEMIRKMTAMFIKVIPDTQKQLSLAMNNSDWALLESLIHRFKPSAQMMGVSAINDDMEALMNIRERNLSKEEIKLRLAHMHAVLDDVARQLSEGSGTGL